MKKKCFFGLTLLSVCSLSFSWGCNDNVASTPNATGGDPGTAVRGGTSASSRGGGSTATGNGGAAVGGAGTSTVGGAGAGNNADSMPNATGGDPGAAVRGGTSASSRGGGSAVTGNGGAASGGAAGGGAVSGGAAGGGAASGGAVSTGGTGGTPTTGGGEQPAPVATPHVWGVGVGITDVPAAIKFYTEVMKMTVEKQDVTRDVGKPSERKETVLYASEAKRGSRLVLMNFKDGRNTKKITTKLVWQASSPSGINRDAASHPDYVSRMSMGIYQFDGPDTYIHEVGRMFDTGGSGITVPYLIAMGTIVTDLAASRAFYVAAFGMTDSYTFAGSVTDATGTGRITEYTVQYSTGGGAGIVLQTWSPTRNSKDNPIKIVLFVPDAQAAADKVVAAGGSITEGAVRTAAFDNRLLIVAKDLDGIILELVQ